MGYAIISMIFVIPATAVIWWVVNLIKYRKSKRENELNPDTYSTEEMQAIKKDLIISSVVAFVLVAVIVSLVVLFAMSIVYM